MPAGVPWSASGRALDSRTGRLGGETGEGEAQRGGVGHLWAPFMLIGDFR